MTTRIVRVAVVPMTATSTVTAAIPAMMIVRVAVAPTISRMTTRIVRVAVVPMTVAIVMTAVVAPVAAVAAVPTATRATPPTTTTTTTVPTVKSAPSVRVAAFAATLIPSRTDLLSGSSL